MERERKKVMVAIDESEESYYALLWALDNLHEILASRQLVIFASEPLPNYTNVFSASLSSARLYTTANPTLDFGKSVQEIEKKVAIGLLEKAKSLCTSRGVMAETILEEGDAKVAICDAVRKYNISMLVLAEQHIGIIKGVFSWSVSNYCVQYAKCPVVVVKKPE
ncbi:hypothetical protein V2J09_003614 [Rumex salicifolius]